MNSAIDAVNACIALRPAIGPTSPAAKNPASGIPLSSYWIVAAVLWSAAPNIRRPRPPQVNNSAPTGRPGGSAPTRSTARRRSLSAPHRVTDLELHGRADLDDLADLDRPGRGVGAEPTRVARPATAPHPRACRARALESRPRPVVRRARWKPRLRSAPFHDSPPRARRNIQGRSRLRIPRLSGGATFQTPASLACREPGLRPERQIRGKVRSGGVTRTAHRHPA
jgi:hypothetical protein